MKRAELHRELKALLAPAVLFCFCATAGTAAEGLKLTEIAENGSSTCRRHHNAGMHAGGRTFVCWSGPRMQHCVKMLDHATGRWSEMRVVHPYQSTDYHDYPVMVVRTDEHLHLFWSKHNGPLHYCRSPQPLDIAGDWTHKELPAVRATYPAPLVDAEGDIYVFYRGRGHAYQSHFDYVRSSDNGRTWTTVEDAIAAKDLGFYLMHTTHEPAHDGFPERLHLTWFLRRGDAHENVYFAYFLPGEDRFVSVNGTDLGAKISEAELDGNCLVDEVNRQGWAILSHYRDDGRPILIYDRPDHTVCARWTGREWERHRTPFRHYRDIEKVGPDHFRVYCPGESRVIWLDSEDGGRGWRKAGELPLPVKHFSQCIVIDNHHPEASLLLKHDAQWTPTTYEGEDLILVVGRRCLRAFEPPLTPVLSGRGRAGAVPGREDRAFRQGE